MTARDAAIPIMFWVKRRMHRRAPTDLTGRSASLNEEVAIHPRTAMFRVQNTVNQDTKTTNMCLAYSCCALTSSTRSESGPTTGGCALMLRAMLASVMAED